MSAIKSFPLFNPGSAFTTESLLADLWDVTLANADEHVPTLLVLFDLSAAFDTVEHDILLRRLVDALGAEGNTAFLKEITRQVRLGNFDS